MIVVADTSPFIAFVSIGLIEVLPILFGRVLIPPEVAAELAVENRPPAVRQFMGAPPAWLTVQSPASPVTIHGLHPGELTAIS